MLGGIRNWFAKIARAPVTMLAWFLTGGSGKDIAGNYASAYRTNPHAFSSVKVIADNVASVPIVIERDGKEGTEPIEGSTRLGDLLAYVNKTDDCYWLMLQTATWLTLTGNAYWLKLRAGKGGVPVALQFIFSDRIQLDKDRFGQRCYKIDTGAGQPSEHPVEDLVHFRTVSINNTHLGMSPMEPLEVTLNTYHWLSGHNCAYFKKGGVPSAVLYMKKKLNRQDVELYRQLWEEWRANNAGSGAPLAMGEDMKFEPIGQKIETGVATELPKFLRETIHAVLGTPPSTVGVLEYANYANMQAQEEMLWNGTIVPLLRLISSAINSQLAPEFGRLPSGLAAQRMRFDTSGVAALQPDQDAMIKRARESTGGGLETLNEARERYLDREPIGPDGDVHLVPMALVPLSSSVAPMEPAHAVPANTPAQPTDTEPTPAKAARSKRLSTEQKRAIWTGYNRERDRRTERLQRAIADWMEDIRDETIANLNAHASEINKSAGSIRAKAVPVDDLAFNADDAAETLTRAAVQRITDDYDHAGQSAIELVTGDRAFSPDTTRFQELIRERRGHLRTVAQDMHGRVQELLADGLAEGENTEQLVQRIIGYTRDATRGRAETIARTETGTAMNRGALEGYRQGGAPAKEWLSVVDDRSRTGHAEMNGTVVRIDEAFKLVSVDGGVIEVQSPHDPAMGPGDAGNCRCVVGPAFDDDLPAEEAA